MRVEQIVREGYVVITPTLCQGDTIAWSTEDDQSNAIPDIYDTPELAWKEIADDIKTNLTQFIEGDRSLEDTDFGSEEYVALYQEFDNGDIVVSDDQGNPIIETTLETWRANL